MSIVLIVSLAPLHGRQTELGELTDRCQDGSAHPPSLVVMYGRRRVGKTFLLQHAAAALAPTAAQTVYFAATRESGAVQRQRFAEVLQPFVAVRSSTWLDLWTDVINRTDDHPLNVLIDEVPYLIESDASWPTALQTAWDSVRHGGATGLTIILTGSAISTMSGLVSSRGALFERPDLIMRLDPFDLPTAATFLGTDDPIAAIEAYTACDGYPLLLSRWDPSMPAQHNLERLAGDPMGALALNASTLLLDLGDYETTQRVLGAIGRGAHRISEINSRAGQRTERPLAVLQGAGFVQQRRSIDSVSKAGSRLELADNYLRFWFQMVEPNQQLIDGGQGVAVIRSGMLRWQHLTAACFERQARNHAARVTGGEAIVGEWWTDRPTQAQLDVVEMRLGRWSLVGEVKWKESFDRSDLARFDRNIAVAGTRALAARLACWSRTGATSEVTALRPELLQFTAHDVVFGHP